MFIISQDDNHAINTDIIRDLEIIPDAKRDFGAEYALMAFTPFTIKGKDNFICIFASDDLSEVRHRMRYITDVINERPKHVCFDRTANEWKSRT